MYNFSISLCVPALNEEKTLSAAVRDLINTLSSLVKELEIIIVDDGSSDSTFQIANNLALEFSQVKVIHHENNLGLGASFKDALAKSKGDYFSWFPADHENSAREFIPCLQHLGKNIIVTSNHRGYDSRPLLRRLISRTYTWIINKYFCLNLKYYNGLTVFPTLGLRSFNLTSDGFFLPAESIIWAVRRGYQVVELSTPLEKRKWGRSKALTLASIIKMLRSFTYFLFNEHKELRK